MLDIPQLSADRQNSKPLFFIPHPLPSKTLLRILWFLSQILVSWILRFPHFLLYSFASTKYILQEHPESGHVEGILFWNLVCLKIPLFASYIWGSLLKLRQNLKLFFFSFLSSEFLASLQLPRQLLRHLKPFLLPVLRMWLPSTSPTTPGASRIFSIHESWNSTVVRPWVGLLFIPLLNPH